MSGGAPGPCDRRAEPPTDETDFRVVIGLYLFVQPLFIALVTIHVAHPFQLRARRAP